MTHTVANDILIPEIERMIHAGQKVLFTPTGVSMRPFIEGGKDSVVLARAETIAPGDILLCRVGDIYVLHRLIFLAGDELTLMGDGNISGTEHCCREDVIGKVVEIRSLKGRRKRLLKGRIWFRLLPLRPYLLKIYRKIIRYAL